MTTNNSRLGAALYNTEATFALASTTFGTRLLPIAAVDVSNLKKKMETISVLQQRPHEGIANVRTVFDGTFSLELLLTGLGSTAAGVITATDLATFLGHVLGTLRASDVGTTAAAGGTTTGLETAGGTFIAGTMLRVGAVGDARGGGQFYPVSTTGANPEVNLLVAMPGAASLADVIYAALQVYPSETPLTFETIQSLRFRLLTANEQYECFGCFPESFEIMNLNAGEVPRVKVGFRCAWFRDTSVTFPDATATSAKAGSPIACGSFFAQVAGTSTRATYALRDFKVSITLKTEPLTGPNAVVAGQIITGARRVRCFASIAAVIDAEATGTNTFYDAWEADQLWHLCWTGSAEDGKAVGLYFPRCKFKEPLPVQKNMSDLNRVSVEWEAMTNTVTTSDLTMSNFRLAMG